MKTYQVKELMIPLTEYATVDEDATLFDAVMALEKAQLAFNHSQYQHRAILILNKEGKVVGKLSQIDVLRTLEPKYAEMQGSNGLSRYGFSKKFMKSMLIQHHLWESPLKDICRKAGEKRVTDFMHAPTEGEYVSEEATLDEAIHQLVLGQHQSLLVTKDNEIVGVLRLTDVFAAVFHVMKQCSI
ncbi:MAG: CBS domain-containing protein [Desulfatirhabdiaceae bacterium]|nr:CBS domain-containing protein [Desulfatirhabdiaceae bacterium]